jgi:hypothetical protein
VRVKPVLGGWEIPRIAAIETRERRRLVELPVPGRVGSLFQDLDAAPTVVAVSGSLYGDEARDALLDEVRGRFAAGEPVTFVADIVEATAVQYVVIEELAFRESGERPDQVDYRLVLRESPPPPPPPDPFGGLDAGLLDQAAGFLDTVTGALDLIDGLGSLPDISNPTEQLGGAVAGVTAVTAGLGDALAPLVGLLGADD